MRHFLQEMEFHARWQAEVLPYLAARREDGFFEGHGGVQLRYVYYRADAPCGTVFLLHGLGESVEKYRELCYYFLLENRSVVLYDHRGHGLSTREADETVTHVRAFSQYVDDLDAAVRRFADTPAPHDLFSHSMGGAIAALYLERGGDFFRRAILTAPMIAPTRKGLPMWATVAYCRFAERRGRGAERVRFLRPFSKKESFRYSHARSRARFETYYRFKQENDGHWNGPPTYSWTAEAYRVPRAILKKGAPERVRAEVRLYSAEHDLLVAAAPQRKFAARVPHATFVPVKNAKHEIYAADEAVLFPYLNDLLDFLSK
ncbi:MAG: alpha/beta hydrolase [Clostridia bacterium]|nr:alpha/beta hydrolase [Clostridia bacterium]